MRMKRVLAAFLAALILSITPVSATVTQDVINGVYGSGDARKANLEKAGYNYEQVQAEVNEALAFKAPVVDNMTAWAKNIAADNRYHYITWKSGDKKAQTCPICTNRKYNDHFGWQCIGFGAACWRHGGGLPINCSYSTISNEEGEALLKAKTDADSFTSTVSEKDVSDLLFAYRKMLEDGVITIDQYEAKKREVLGKK